MKNILALLLLPLLLNAFTLSVSSGKNNEKEYNIIDISNEQEFDCVAQILEYDQSRYVCMLNSSNIAKLQDESLKLVDIIYKREDNKLFVVIIPKSHSRIYNLDQKLFEDQKVYKNNKNMRSKHFSILIDPNISEFEPIQSGGLNFAPKFFHLLKPNIGALDLNKSPIDSLDSNDIDIYISIKKAFDTKKFDRVIHEATQAILRHENSLFAAEFILYKLRALNEILKDSDEFEGLGYDNIIKEGKNWMLHFPSDESYPEVLYLITRAYIKEGHLSDANYTLDILLAEHSKSIWSENAQLDFANALYAVGKSKEAVNIYEDVLYRSKYVDIASRAALRLADTNIEREKFKEAKDFVLKVLNANSKIFLQNPQKALELAKSFDEKNMQDISSKIYEILANSDLKNTQMTQRVLKDWGISLAKSGQSQKAYNILQKYKKEYPYGDYIEQIQKELDGLFFDTNESNSNKLHEYYDQLIKKYGNDEIGKKALLSQIELSLKEKDYKKVLNYTDMITDLNSSKASKILSISALELIKNNIRQDDCNNAVRLLEKYDVNKLELPQFKLYDCYKRTARYKDALELAKAHSQDDNLLDRVEWLVRLSQAELKSKQFNEALKIANDAVSLGARVEYSDISGALFVRFYSLLELSQFNKAIQTIKAIEQLNTEKTKLLDAYDMLSKYASSKSEWVHVNVYAKKAMNIQAEIGINTYSPELEIRYINALINLDHIKDAIFEANSLLSRKLSPRHRQQIQAILANAYITDKQNSKAIEVLKECANSNFESEFRTSCTAGLELLNKGGK